MADFDAAAARASSPLLRARRSTRGRGAIHPPTRSLRPKRLPPLGRLTAVVIVGLTGACQTISTYDQAAYEHATNAKVEAVALMDNATTSYSEHAREVAALKLTLQKAYEYDKGRPVNQITIALWDKLLDPSRDLLGGFLREWKEDGPLLPKYVANKKDQVASAFDVLIQLESGKIKPSEVAKP